MLVWQSDLGIDLKIREQSVQALLSMWLCSSSEGKSKALGCCSCFWLPFIYITFVIALQLKNDEHTFKWVDEAHLNEIEALQIINGRLEREVKEIVAERKETEQILFDKVQMKVEKEIFERVEVVLAESSSKVKKIMIVVVIVCMVMVGCSKLIG